MLVTSPGAGKTVIACALIVGRRYRTDSQVLCRARRSAHGLCLAGGGPDGPTGVPIASRQECSDAGLARSIDTPSPAPSAKEILTSTSALSFGLGTNNAVAVPAAASALCVKSALVILMGVLAASATASRPATS